MACQSGNQKFLVSVGKAMAFDTTCAGKQLVFVADTLINSTITQAIQSAQVYGGPGSRLLYEYDYQKEITVTLEDAAFSPTYLAIQNGSKLTQQLSNVYERQTVTFDATGSATLPSTPVGEVQVGLEDGTFINVLPAGNAVVVASLADKESQVIYLTEKNVKKLVIDSSSFPTAMELVISIDIFDSSNKKVETMEIVIPKFKPDGNFEMSLTHDGVATSSITGKAFDDCGKYAEINFIPAVTSTESCTVTGLIVTPNPIELDSTVAGDSIQLVVRQEFSDGSLSAPLATNAVTYASDNDTDVTVNATGLVTLAAGTLGDTATITVTQTVGNVTTAVPVTVV